MDACDVLIVGGGPAGASCAWNLQDSGLRVAILDKAAFPRDKVCGGWITLPVLDELKIQPDEYARGRVLQPITGFRVGSMGGRELETHYRAPVSYGIRRCEFDDYLLRRSGARLLLGRTFTRLERSRGEWIVNGEIRTPMLVGAGGTFCPVARFLGAKVNRETVVAAREVEFAMDSRQAAACAVRAEIPELYFCPDMKGYGWCFRKENVLNIGLGRMDAHGLAGHVEGFLKYLRERERLRIEPIPPMHGHAYLLYGRTPRNLVDEGVVLIGDAAGLAYAQSGEGIRPAIESGLMAARAIGAAQGIFSPERLELYRDLLLKRFGKTESHWATRIGSHLPTAAITFLARRLLTAEWFTRGVVLDRWFLHREEAALGV
ncbi:MAG TPA: NAD(P)/FAD-dependent oxidoreductase [Bryobacteraceae bacterium]|nr:NAD(P)/FAD-dependent oxidoreductase [Bryobacteraceae bacterium]